MSDYIVHKAIEPDAISSKTREVLEQPRLWIASPKFDGCHSVFLFDDGTFVGAFSRTGEVVRSMDHVGIYLTNVVPDSGKWAVCGEAWNGVLHFNEVSGSFRQHREATELQFVPFDFVPWAYNTETTSQPNLLLNPYGDAGSYLHRLEKLCGLLKDAERFRTYPSVVPVFHPLLFMFRGTLSEAIAEFTAPAQRLKEGGVHDGMILALADGTYTPGAGRGGEFIKLKPLISYTVAVEGSSVDKGEKTGKNTAVLLFSLDGRTQRVSTGLSQQQVDDIAADPQSWVGKLIEVEAMGKTVNGFLREPRFKGIRTDA